MARDNCTADIYESATRMTFSDRRSPGRQPRAGPRSSGRASTDAPRAAGNASSRITKPGAGGGAHEFRPDRAWAAGALGPCGPGGSRPARGRPALVVGTRCPLQGATIPARAVGHPDGARSIAHPWISALKHCKSKRYQVTVGASPCQSRLHSIPPIPL